MIISNIKESMELYKEYLVGEELDNKTIDTYIHYVIEFICDMNVRTLNDINNLSWMDVKLNYLNNKKDDGLKSQSINIRISSLRSYLNFLLGCRAIDSNIAEQIKKERTSKKTVEFDREKIINYIKMMEEAFNQQKDYLSCRNKMIVKILLATGLRESELRNMTTETINFNTGEFVVTGKRNKVRQLCLPSALMNEYREYLQYRMMMGDTINDLFVGCRGDKLGKNTICTMIKKTSNQVGLDYTTHSLRHIAITNIINKTKDIEGATKIAGHSNTTITTGIYAEDVADRTKQLINDAYIC